MPLPYRLLLNRPPIVQWVGIGHHGHHSIERYLLPDLWCVHLFRDAMELRVADEALEVRPGFATIIPPGASIEFRFPVPAEHWHAFAHFREGSVEVERNGNGGDDGEGVEIPGIQDLGSRFEPLFAILEAAISASDGPPAHASALVWSVLWALANRSAERGANPLVTRARTLIEKKLGDPLSVAALARELGVSHNHLTRQFRSEYGQTVVEFIRERRVKRAEHLLRHSTLPIKAVAAQVGLGDFHSFNKAMRRASGESPRRFRNG